MDECLLCRRSAVRDTPRAKGWALAQCPPNSERGPSGNTGEIKAARKGTGHPTSQSRWSRTNVLSNGHFPQRTDRIWYWPLHFYFTSEGIVNNCSFANLNALVMRSTRLVWALRFRGIILAVGYPTEKELPSCRVYRRPRSKLHVYVTPTAALYIGVTRKAFLLRWSYCKQIHSEKPCILCTRIFND